MELRPPRGAPQRPDSDFGTRYIIHAGKQSFGFADYFYSPPGGVPDQRFTVMFLGPAGACKVPARASLCLTITVAVLVSLLLGLVSVRRRSQAYKAPAPGS
jgi:hypothetical protein